ncbi:hypothetical protein [Methylobacterium platani]|uniref:Uncharacterized protein n=2 Tax=Methylobacterium platani TaxID=427683 RepID=A0A179SBR4_9HYPH|nr:hypothetical protein [Methylobacterium platani]KMO21334.1 hypothetical protein SQ03_03555 [Methylobacterium platani JCM 14648]OAS25081.1 hypothetical protein A5481_11340 [Methylobacterium platani]
MSDGHLPWRWSAVPLQFFGIHGSIAAFFPLLIITGLSRYTFIAMGLYAAFLAYCNHRKMTPMRLLKYVWAKFIEGGKWPAF